MKIKNILAALFLAAGLLWIGSGSTVKAAGSGDLDDPRITDGVFIEEIDVSGMTAGEAQAAVESYVSLQRKSFENYLADQYEVAKGALVKTLPGGEIVLVMSEGAADIMANLEKTLK